MNTHNPNTFNMDFSFVNAVDHYKRIGVKVNPESTIEEINKIETTIGFNFPNDYREFHLLSNGFADGDMDNFNFSIWSFERLIEEFEEEKEGDFNFIPICDYLINSYQFGYMKGFDGIYMDIEKEKPIAKNFTEFLKLLLLDSDKLY